MQIYYWLVSAAALGINVHALVALVRGMRARDAATIARHARRCGWSIAGVVLLLAAGLAATFLTNDIYRSDGPEARATRLAMMISELMNCVAFIVILALLPSIAAAVLHVRAQRRKSGE
jgi:hypothetical protein